ncbi:pyridoxal-phosphate-dependent aminotransferase family protein [Halorarius litoreus]|uniref:pyridoxal-phosphate-dependent aminotransferase family protein n=1 Tax=Halorarius litoreus TaxID=2962676 RepID=UPI0020CCFFF3|nr:alanine--glyoxylate aminotransferase family protein [Halorarius litoreus]
MEAPDIDELVPADRTLMGPGPSDVHPRVLRAMATPLVGYLDPTFVDVMNDVQAGLRYLLQTDNEHTLAVSGTGSAAMECAFGNLVEPGETVLVPDNGYFGQRMGEMADRAGGDVATVDAPWGEPLSVADIEAAFADHQPRVVGIVHGETSTGVKQGDIDAIVDVAHDHDAYVIVDTVASLGGVEFRTDDWNVDVVYSGSQKCLSAPPGASPITFSERAVEKVWGRETQSNSWYLDLEGLWSYWGDDPAYHHTGMTSTLYAAREALRLVAEEGIEARWDRHERMAGALVAGVEAMGLSILPAEADWLPSLNAVRLPADADGGELTATMLADHDIEIAGGLGALAGDIVRVGCMGHSARPSNVLQTVGALGRSLEAQGVDVDTGAGVAAANAALDE